jgi:cbb3-type cytochrome oxidase subunit 1
MGGALIVISFILFTYNIYATVLKRRTITQPTHLAEVTAVTAGPGS